MGCSIETKQIKSIAASAEEANNIYGKSLVVPVPCLRPHSGVHDLHVQASSVGDSLALEVNVSASTAVCLMLALLCLL